MEKESSYFKAHCIKVCFEINLSYFFYSNMYGKSGKDT